MATGTIQAGGGQYVELKDGMMRRLAEATGRTVVYNSLSQTMRRPNEWKEHMARIEETAAMGIRAYPMCSPNRVTQDFTMKNSQVFRGLPTWHPILLMSDIDTEVIVEPVHVLRHRLPFELDRLQHLHRDRFDIGEELGEPLLGAASHRR